ncbi:MAG: hypothetical protein JWO10_1947 [Microbacteriaceae bacterium]|nr:hypothetical protein [Microbacteriaceae bacterium]
MDIRIGITNSPREINFESSQSASDVEKVISSALDSAAKYIRLVDNKGTIYIVPVDAFGYIEVGSEESRRVGFVA